MMPTMIYILSIQLLLLFSCSSISSAQKMQATGVSIPSDTLIYDAGNLAYSTVFQLARRGDVDLMRKVHEKCGNLLDYNVHDNDGNTPLMIAVVKNNYDVIKFLIEVLQVDINKKNLEGMTALSYAIILGYPEIVRLLLSSPRIDPEGNYACFNGATILQYIQNKQEFSSAYTMLFTHMFFKFELFLKEYGVPHNMIINFLRLSTLNKEQAGNSTSSETATETTQEKSDSDIVDSWLSDN